MKSFKFFYITLFILIILVPIAITGYFFLGENFIIAIITLSFIGILLFVFKYLIFIFIEEYFFEDIYHYNIVAIVNIGLYFLIHFIKRIYFGDVNGIVGFSIVWIVLSYSEYYELKTSEKK